MEITITEIIEESFEEYRVTFQSPFGSMSARWLGEVLDVGEQYAMEIEIEDMLTWGVDITLQEDKGYYIFEEGGQKYFCGRIWRIDDDGLLMLKVGTSLFMISTSGEPLAQNGFVEVKADNVAIYDEGL